MSLINKMLQDLDKRHAANAGGKKTLTEQLRPVQVPKDWRRIVIEVLAGLIVGGGWAVWVMYQISPRSVVTELAYQSRMNRAKLAVARQSPAQVPQAAAVPAVPAPAASSAVLAPADTAAAPVAPVPDVTRSGEPVRVKMLKLATEIGTPLSERSTGARPKAERKPAADAARKGKHAQEPASPANSPAPKGRSLVSIDKQIHVPTRAERAENDFRKATGLLNQGRVAEAIDGYKSTLAENAAHGAARQALVGLLLENRRIDEAQQFLQEGLSLNPDRSSYAILLARIQVERGDLQGAHDLLSRHTANAANNADYHAFDAALLQRLGRHKEAVTGYQAALKISPNSGVWWMGMGISLQAENRDAEARDAFKRAKSAGGLGPELVSFIDQRLKQLH
ncbi:MAG: tetratricopeptide repeat protein [Pseudomonadota bacterium]